MITKGVLQRDDGAHGAGSVHDNVDYIDLGADWAVRRHGPEHQLARLVRQIEKLGREVTVTMPAA